MEAQPILLSSAYLPPIGYLARIIRSSGVVFEKHENFIKQSYRNRCVVSGANGPISLVIPVEKARCRKVLITETRIYNHDDWQRIHWRTICSAYNSSPFFEYYQDYFAPFYEKHWEFLFDFNQALMEIIFEILGISPKISYTSMFEKSPAGVMDARYSISPKQKSELPGEPYTQVFSGKFGFIPHLSFLDLLFNEGPNSVGYLENY